MGTNLTTELKTTRALRPTWVLPAAFLLVLLVTGIMVGKFQHHDVKDAEVWYDVGQRVLHGQPILHLQHYRYSPAFAVLIAPLCVFGWPVFFFLWYGLNLLLFALSLRVVLRIAWGDASPPPLASWLPALLVLAYLIDNLYLGQTNVLVMALLYTTMWALVQKHEWWAGVPLAVTIAIKVFTLPWLAYLVFRGRLRAVAATLGALLFFLFLLPAPVRGFSRNYAEVADWSQRVVAPYLTKGEAGDWGQHSLDYGNQSLQAVLHRLLSHVDANVRARHEAPLYVHFTHLTESHVNFVILLSLAILAAIFITACGWRPPRDLRLWVIEFSMSIILVLLASALAWTYFFVMLLLPIASALMVLYQSDSVRPGTRQLLRIALWVQAIVVLLMARHLGGPYLRAVGSICWASILLYVALAKACWEIRRNTRQSSIT